MRMAKEEIVTELVALYDVLAQSDFSTAKQDKAVLEAIDFLKGRRK